MQGDGPRRSTTATQTADEVAAAMEALQQPWAEARPTVRAEPAESFGPDYAQVGHTVDESIAEERLDVASTRSFDVLDSY